MQYAEHWALYPMAPGVNLRDRISAKVGGTLRAIRIEGADRRHLYDGVRLTIQVIGYERSHFVCMQAMPFVVDALELACEISPVTPIVFSAVNHSAATVTLEGDFVIELD